jgi:2-polyprenyl-3-methyl-5-hydroxy-6-metoxy-1,4-benzoquinol methylase
LRREVSTDLSILTRLVDPAGKDVVDIGCGGGALVRQLASLGARVVGIEISEQQLRIALARDDRSGARYLVGGGQDLPLAGGSVDLAVFMRTLHHLPPPTLPRALREAARVLRPGGDVYVAEPLAQGDFFTITSLVEDELEVRAAAQQALGQAARVGLDRVTTVSYDVRVCIPDLEALRTRIVSVDPHRAEAFDAHREELADAFQSLGEDGEQAGERCFIQPMRADVLRAGVP